MSARRGSLRKLRRDELLEIAVEQSRELDELHAQVGPAQDETPGTPDTASLETELEHARRKKRAHGALRKTVSALITIAAAAVLITTLLLPVLRIYGTSMTPTLQAGEYVVALKTSHFEPGDVVAFKFDNKILVKRVIASAGQWVDIDADGNVSVDGVRLDEPYIAEKSLGNCDISLPYQVPDGRVFVMGDHRSTSIDSRSTALGCVSQEQIVGKALLRVWPLDQFGLVR